MSNMVGIENLILKRNTKGQRMNIPIYRAKKIQSDEYVVGYYTEKVKQYPGRHYIHFNNGYTETYERIDPLTLAVHFKDMVDSEGSKIFASLSKDGKGGDILDISGRTETLFIEEAVIQTYMFKWDDLKDFKKKAIGIQE